MLTQMDSGRLLLLFPHVFRSQQVALCVSHVFFSSYMSMFLYSFLFPVAVLTGMPLVSPEAKLGFPICDMDEDRGSLLHFKSN